MGIPLLTVHWSNSMPPLILLIVKGRSMLRDDGATLVGMIAASV